ncbi:A-kinase anchor protein SPHKAP-like isoform X2 [Polyodon spathula]|uniref:A-kinase anchor protein SPHKAP-like isoform X2 n=1 Tax=Polyodon spathula TaxID=7913 RepID=UPI001B7DADE2|nr:A-kinase anchor protein SPHKAP-like isoform X2 [Polyodon spathula]
MNPVELGWNAEDFLLHIVKGYAFQKEGEDMLSALINMLKNLTERNFEATSMFELSEKLEDPHGAGADSSDSTLGSSITACKKVLCSTSLLDSTEYWLRNEGALCRIGLMEDKTDNSCTTICFVNLDDNSTDCSNEKLTQKLATISSDLPKLIDSLNVRQPKENEIFLLSGLDACDNLQPDSEFHQSCRAANVCLVQSAREKKKKTHPSCIIYEINKFLIGLESGQERQLQLDRSGNARPEDDTNRSVSSIEEDFLTASEHLDDESEEDGFRNDRDNNDATDLFSGVRNTEEMRLGSRPNKKTPYSESTNAAAETMLHSTDKPMKQHHCNVPLSDIVGHQTDHQKRHQSTCQRHCAVRSADSAQSRKATKDGRHTVNVANTRQSSKAQSDMQFPLQNTQASAGYYATNLAESVLQDAFIKLSQAEATFTTEAALSVSAGHTILTASTEETKPTRAWNDLPKIVIVQSPDNCEITPEWPGTPPSNTSNWTQSESPSDIFNQITEEIVKPYSYSTGGHTPHPVEVALACAASVIGTISSPQATEKLKLDQSAADLNVIVPEEQTTEKEEKKTEKVEDDQEESSGMDFSFSSALCGMAQVASAIAVVGLDDTLEESYSMSRGLLSATEASTAITLHCSVAVGTKINQFTAGIAEVLIKEASAILYEPDVYKSVGDFLESTRNKVVESVAKLQSTHLEADTDDFAQIMSEAIFKLSFERAKKKKELESPNKDSNTVLNPQDILESTNNLLFNMLYLTCKKIGDIASHNNGSLDLTEVKSCSTDCETVVKQNRVLSHKLSGLLDSCESDNCDNHNNLLQSSDKLSGFTCVKEDIIVQEKATYIKEFELCSMSQSNKDNSLSYSKDTKQRPSQVNMEPLIKDCTNLQGQSNNYNLKYMKSSLDNDKPKAVFDLNELSREQHFIIHNSSSTDVEKQNGSLLVDNEYKLSSLSPQQSLSSLLPVVLLKPVSESRSPVTSFAEDLATTVVSMATEMAAICLENSNGKQPWFCAWKGGPENLDNYLVPCRTVKRKKETQSNASVTKKHRPPRLSEIKRKTEEQPELKERLMNRVVDESMNFDEPPDPFRVFANEVTAKIMNCPELSVVDTSKQGQSQPRNHLHCDRWNKGKASSYESIPEEDASSLINTLGPGTMLGQNLSRGGSISKQSSCESITDEFSRFMVNQMENEGRGFDLLLDYYAEQNAVSILSSALQQVTKKNGHLNIRSTCVSKQSSTESITEEFYRFMIKEMDNENKDYSVAKTKAWSNSFLAPSPRTSFCVRQSSVPDRRSSDSRLTVNAPVKANSFDGFARNVHADALNIYPVNTVSSTGLCKSDSCLYKRGGIDQITDMLIHETWSSSIESLMRKNKIIVDEDDSMDLDQPENGSQMHVEQFASRLAADIVERGTSSIGGQQGPVDCQLPIPVAEKRRCFRSKTQSHFKKPAIDKIQTQEKKPTVSNDSACIASPPCCPREVPLIHIEIDQREEFNEDIAASAIATGKLKTEYLPDEKDPELVCQKNTEQPSINQSSPACYKTLVTAVADKASVSEECPTLSCSDDSTGSWSQIANEDDPPEDTSSYLQLSEGNGNSSASSSLVLVDLEGLQETVSPCPLISKIVEEKKILKENQDNLDECTSGLSVGINSCHKDLLVMNFDLEPDCVDSELRATLQWIAASELGVPTIYFIKSQEKRIEKFLDVVRFVQQKAWNVGDLFRAVVQYCKLQEEKADAVSSLFDWLLDLS